jgi:hypothetical protein
MDAPSTKDKRGKRSFKWWAAVGALLATGVVPCPECGAPLALHTWPLLMWLLLARRTAGRPRPRAKEKTPGESVDSDTPRMPLE